MSLKNPRSYNLPVASLMKDTKNNSAFSQSFSDIDQFCESLEGWDIEFHQIKPGSGAAKLSVMTVGGNSFQRVAFDCRVQQFGSTPANAVTFGFLLEDHADINWCSERGGQSDVMLFPANEWECISEAGFVGHTLSFDMQTIERARKQLGGDSVELFGAREPRLISHAMKGQLGFLRRELDDCFDALESNQLMTAKTGVFDDLANELALELVAAANGRLTSDQLPMPNTRERVRKRARDIIHSHSSQDINVSLLCEQLGTSRSTLERSFTAYYGVGPKHYIKLVRLHRLHHQLRRGGPEARVTNMAMDQGFFHMGQLGRDYFRQFGCLPSETLKK